MAVTLKEFSKEREERMLKKVYEYHDRMVNKTNIIDPKRTEVEYVLSRRMTRFLGVCEYLGTTETGVVRCRIKLSLPLYLEYGDEVYSELIRHLLIHIWQHQEFGKYPPDIHGKTFESKMDSMRVKNKHIEKPLYVIPRSLPKPGYKYGTICENCGTKREYETINPLIEEALKGKPIECEIDGRPTNHFVFDLKTRKVLNGKYVNKRIEQVTWESQCPQCGTNYSVYSFVEMLKPDHSNSFCFNCHHFFIPDIPDSFRAMLLENIYLGKWKDFGDFVYSFEE